MHRCAVVLGTIPGVCLTAVAVRAQETLAIV
jgi:hypothetical protein